MEPVKVACLNQIGCENLKKNEEHDDISLEENTTGEGRTDNEQKISDSNHEQSHEKNVIADHPSVEHGGNQEAEQNIAFVFRV